MAPGPLAPSGENGVKAGSGGGAFGSQVDLAAATEGLSISGNKPQTLAPVAETPAKDAAVRCVAVMDVAGCRPISPVPCRPFNRPQVSAASAALVQAPAEPLNEMDQLKAVLARTKAAQAKYARFSQEQVGLQGSTPAPA